MITLDFPDPFCVDTEWELNACLNFEHDMTYCYVEGFVHAADLLFEHVAKTSQSQDFLVYPIAFMYRHHIELCLKKVVELGDSLEGVSLIKKPNHLLEPLWERAKRIIVNADIVEPKSADLKSVEQFIKRFAEVDTPSTHFRYPKQKGGCPSLEGIRHINLRNLSTCVHSVSTFLDCPINELGRRLDFKLECERKSKNRSKPSSQLAEPERLD